MAGTYYKYAERESDSQVNWASVGKDMSDMLAETNRVREEKKAALDAAQRESLKYLSETPNGEHVGARQSILEYSNQASNQMRIQYDLMKRGLLDPKDYMIFRQNLTDNTNLAFNANKAYQENYADIMKRSRDGVSSGLELDNASEVERFGNWKNMGWQISPNGIVMAGQMTEQDVDGKKVRALDKTPGALRSMDYLNQAILGRIDKYDYKTPVKTFVDGLGEEKKTVVILGKIEKQGKITSIEDITSRQDINPEDKSVLFKFIQAENDKIKEIAGTNLDSARILYDSAKIAPNGEPYKITTNAQEAKRGNNYILKVVDPDSGGFKYELTDGQKKDAEEFIRTQMRAQYDYKEDVSVVGQVSRDEKRPKSEAEIAKDEKEKKETEIANMLGKFYYGNQAETDSATDYFKGFTDKEGVPIFDSIERTPDGIFVTLSNGQRETISFKGKTQEDFIRSAGPLLAKEYDVNNALRKGSYKKGGKFNEETNSLGKTTKPSEVYAQYINESLDPSIIGLSEEDALETIQEIASKAGFTADQSGVGNYITITRPKLDENTPEVSQQFSFKESDPEKQEKVKRAIIGFLTANASSSSIKKSLGNWKSTQSSNKKQQTNGVGSKYN